MAVSTESKYIEAISANVANTRFEDFDQATIDLAKNRVIDVLGCLIGGANAPGNPALLKLVKRWGGKKEATILVHGGKAPAQTVAMLNTIMARSFDFEVMSYVHEGKYIRLSSRGYISPHRDRIERVLRRQRERIAHRDAGRR